MSIEKKPTLVVGTVSLSSVPPVIIKEFSMFVKKMILPNEVAKLPVNDEDSLTIANLKLKECIAVEREIEAKRQELKEPFNYIGSAIQAEAKKYSVDIESSKSILTKKITDYKNLKIAQQSAIEEARRAEAEIDLKRKEAILERISRITLQFRALLFGGEIYLSTGEIKPVAQPKTVDDLVKIKAMVEKSFPDFNKFEEYRHTMVDTLETFISDIETMKLCFENGNAQTIDILRKKYNNLCNITEEQVTKTILKEENRMEKEIQAEQDDVSKGIREWLKFSVVNKVEVPDNFKVVDEVLVNNYIRANKDLVSQYVKEGKSDELIPGIQFRIEKKYVAR